MTLQLYKFHFQVKDTDVEISHHLGPTPSKEASKIQALPFKGLLLLLLSPQSSKEPPLPIPAPHSIWDSNRGWLGKKKAAREINGEDLNEQPATNEKLLPWLPRKPGTKGSSAHRDMVLAK